MPHLAVTGGNKVALLYAEALAARGHDVTVIHGRSPVMDGTMDKFFRRRHAVLEVGHGVREIFVSGPVMTFSEALPDADALVATWWETVQAVSSAAPQKGRKFHFVQGHEVFPWLPARAADVYRLPFHKIAVSQWLVDLLANIYGSTDVSLVLNPVDVERFAWRRRSKSAVPTVGTVYSVTPLKNSGLALEAVALARERIPDLRLVCFGHERPANDLLRQGGVEFHLKPDQELIPDLYRACDCWLFTSTEEGFGLPILEAMAVGTPVIATRSGAAPNLVTPKTGALVDFDAAVMAEEIIKLISKAPSEWEAMSLACRSMAERHDEENAVSDFEKVLLSVTHP